MTALRTSLAFNGSQRSTVSCKPGLWSDNPTGYFSRRKSAKTTYSCLRLPAEDSFSRHGSAWDTFSRRGSTWDTFSWRGMARDSFSRWELTWHSFNQRGSTSSVTVQPEPSAEDVPGLSSATVTVQPRLPKKRKPTKLDKGEKAGKAMMDAFMELEEKSHEEDRVQDQLRMKQLFWVKKTRGASASLNSNYL